MLLAVLLWFSPSLLRAQDAPQETAPTRLEYFQIFLDDPAQKVNAVLYSDDSGPVEFKLSSDGKSIHLLNYKGEGGIKAQIIDAEGLEVEVVRSKCHVHSLQEL